LFAVACGGGGGTEPSGNNSNAMTISISRNATVMGAQSFSPNPASAGGQRVVFKNNDGEVHNIRLNDGSASTGDIGPGATSSAVTMPSGGANYHCTIHPDMIGAVNPASGGPPPDCTGECGDDNPNDGY
jgi:plastocyanin